MPPWHEKDEKCSEPIEVADDEEDDDHDNWGQWNDSWWQNKPNNKSDKDEPSASSGNSKRTSTTPPRRRRATAAGSSNDVRPDADMGSAMASWRNLLGIPDYGATGVQALPPQQHDVIYDHALATPTAEFLQLMAGWNRFVALILAEVNHALVRAKKQQERNREAWSKGGHDKAPDRDGKDGGDADATSMMQTTSGTPVYTQMVTLQRSFDELSPRRRAIRAFLLLQHLRGSGHFVHGRRALAAQLRAVEQLLLSQHPVQASAYEDIDVQWCQSIWEELRAAMDHVLLNAEPTQPLSLPRKRQRVETHASTADQQRGRDLRVQIHNQRGQEIGSCQVLTTAADGAVQVSVQHGPSCDPGSSSSSGSAPWLGSAAETTLLVLPCTHEPMYQLWRDGILDDAAIITQAGAGTLNAFRVRQSGKQGGHEGSPISVEGGNQEGGGQGELEDAME